MKIIILFHLKKIRLRCSIWEDFIKLNGRILCIENDEKLTQEEVDRADELQQIAFPDEWKDQNPNDKKED